MMVGLNLESSQMIQREMAKKKIKKAKVCFDNVIWIFHMAVSKMENFVLKRAVRIFNIPSIFENLYGLIIKWYKPRDALLKFVLLWTISMVFHKMDS